VLAPVTMTVLPERSNEAGVGGILIWPMLAETRMSRAFRRREIYVLFQGNRETCERGPSKDEALNSDSDSDSESAQGKVHYQEDSPQCIPLTYATIFSVQYLYIAMDASLPASSRHLSVSAAGDRLVSAY